MAASIRTLPGVSDVFIPQDVDYPSLRLDIDRERAASLGLNQREVVDNVITALTSNQMIAPSYWVDPKSGNDYMLTVQYPENRVRNLLDLRGIPLRGERSKDPTLLDAVTTGDAGHDRRPRSITTRSAASSTSTSIPPARTSARLATGIRDVLADDEAARRRARRTSAAWCRGCRRRSRASASG